MTDRMYDDYSRKQLVGFSPVKLADGNVIFNIPYENGKDIYDTFQNCIKSEKFFYGGYASMGAHYGYIPAAGICMDNNYDSNLVGYIFEKLLKSWEDCKVPVEYVVMDFDSSFTPFLRSLTTKPHDSEIETIDFSNDIETWTIFFHQRVNKNILGAAIDPAHCGKLGWQNVLNHKR